jgi:hypothetical protein
MLALCFWLATLQELSRRTLPGPAGVLVGFVSRVMNACLCAVHTHKVMSGRA